MAGVAPGAFTRPLLVWVGSGVVPTPAGYYAIPAASTTQNILPIFPWLGWGAVRIYAEADQVVTLNILQRERSGDGSVNKPWGTFRQTDTIQFSSGANVLSKSFLCSGEYARIQIVTGLKSPTRIVVYATLFQVSP